MVLARWLADWPRSVLLLLRTIHWLQLRNFYKFRLGDGGRHCSRPAVSQRCLTEAQLTRWHTCCKAVDYLVEHADALSGLFSFMFDCLPSSQKKTRMMSGIVAAWIVCSSKLKCGATFMHNFCRDE